MKISWTPKARRTYFEVIKQLEKSWTEIEIQNFIKKELQLIVFWDNRQDPGKLPY